LAAVVVIAKAGSFHSALVTISLALVYLFLMIKVIKPYLKKISGIFSTRETMHKWIVALVFIILLVSAYFAEIIGIHTLFGAFLAGVIMPAEINFRKTIIEKVEDVSLVLLLPLFFVLTGLQTQIGLLSSTAHWLVFGLVFLIAITGKFAGSTLAARFTGQNWHDSLSLGALMNTRGLMELVVLTIGYNMGILPPVIFTMLVLMAILTTFMTAPSLYIIHRLFPEHKTETVEVDSNRLSRILISFGPVQSGIKLLRIAGELIDKTNEYSVITALHLTSGTDVNPLKTVEFEDESFNPVREEAGKLGIKLKTKYQVTDNVSREVFRKVISSKCDLLLIGAGKSLYRGTLIGSLLKSIKTFNPVFLFEWLVKKSHPEQYLIHEKARYILDNAPCSVGVFIDANFIQAKRILLPVLHTSDIAMLPFYNHLISHDKQEIVLIDAVNLSGDYSVFATIKENNNVKMLDIEDSKPELLSHFQLILLSYESWKLIVKYHKNWLDLLPSTLIIKPK
jgi:nucleotide-binding universal stress UspA family protein